MSFLSDRPTNFSLADFTIAYMASFSLLRLGEEIEL